MHERRHWTEEQDNLIKQSMQNIDNVKWSKILKQIKAKNPDFHRTSKQIRERWKFSLDPQLSNQNFTSEEQQIIFKSHVIKGSKWKQIQKLLPNRSQKSIKNFFYMSLRKSFRRISKILGAKNSTDQSRQIKPQVISKLIESYNENSQKRQAVYRLFNLHKIKSGQCRNLKFQLQEMLTYRQILDDLISINQLYTVDKKQGLVMLEQKIQSSKMKNGTSDKLAEKSTIYGTIFPQQAGQTPVANLDQIDQQVNIQINLQENSVVRQYPLAFQFQNNNVDDINMFQT